ncbi:hypothetical protein A2914_02265 [Candidatus Nomurabacteria bacterium RIFCSPLOWO2_01_FULL_41_21]|uniref:Uncharacterized protein n=2 Tax=Candidatus Nomuraibacteriota TaxID=1752729 RepID=A0A1F6V306_9BACT|nr:MAG: hypothetical protein A2733_01655 [Candidatus Nomurabacteria bacterium RIFCSPHIGHO2_01_FULL_40_20]OGI88750.1 MAG: hypothetical protein A2914_02265 [Candidatus Nomurabacteria bacterium RIFCSPLOWO2_01_FULL_41_21]
MAHDSKSSSKEKEAPSKTPSRIKVSKERENPMVWIWRALIFIIVVSLILGIKDCAGCGSKSTSDDSTENEDRTEVLVYELVNVNGKTYQDSLARGFAGYQSKKHSDPFIFEITEEVLKKGDLDRDIRFESDYSIVVMLPERDFPNKWFTVYYCGEGPLVISKPVGLGKVYIYKSKEPIPCL